MKASAIVRIVAFSLAIIMLGGVLLSAIAEDLYLNEHIHSMDSTEALEKLDIAYYSTDVRNIEIDWACGNISILSDEFVEEIVVSEHAPIQAGHEMVCKQSGQTLFIRYSDKDFELFGLTRNNFESKDLVIRVPDEWIGKNIEIDTASAVVVLNGLILGTFDFDGASGDCSITECTISEVDVDTASGNISFTGTLDVLECDAASADCDIVSYCVPRSIKMDAASGDLSLVLPPDAGFTCELEALNGKIKTDFECTAEGTIYTCGDGACQIKVNAMSGDVSILKGIEKETGIAAK